MNNCYMKESKIRREYFYEIPEPEEDFPEQDDQIGRAVDRVLEVLETIWHMLVLLCCKPATRRGIRYIGVAICFFCFLGVVGGIEQGLISVGFGVVVGMFLIFIELFCLR